MSWMFRLRCRLRRLLGLRVTVVGYKTTWENGELKQTPIYVDQFYK